MMENQSEQCIILSSYVHVCMQKLFVVFANICTNHPSLLNVHDPYNSTCENSSKSVGKINLAASLKTENV